MIGIGITTRNRFDVFMQSYIQIMAHLPDNARVIVVDDASDQPLDWADYRFDENAGIAKAKNKCLELLEDCEHIFLFDSDCHPISEDWWKPYIESGQSHLMYQFKLPGKPANDMQELRRDDMLVGYTHTRGAMLYVHRSVLNVVGGLDTAYGSYGYEHADWTNRIHNAGLTTYRAMDVVGSDKLLYCLDQDGKIESSVPDDVRKQQLQDNHALYRKNRNSKEFKEYK